MRSTSPPRPILLALIAVLITMGLASMQPLSWSDYLLHQAGTVLFLTMIYLAYRFYEVRVQSFVLASLFLIIHIIGARYLYSYVPYDDWSHALIGYRLADIFVWQRNMYDRWVHFSYGLLLFSLMLDVFRYKLPTVTNVALIVLVLQFNLASSTLYELFEWMLAVGLSPEAAEAYNGQQGDIWDAQKDITLAFLGALLAVAIYFINHRHRRHQE